MLAFALSVDACVVSFSYGLVYEKNRFKNALLISCCTGFFQGIMPFFGYYLTGFVKNLIQPYSRIIIFSIFVYLGIKFIIEAFSEHKKEKLCIDLKCLLMIGIATSIDAFSAGISLALYGNNILKPAILIGLITLINSNIGFVIGSKLKSIPTRILEVSAGLLLIILGIKAIFV